MSKPFALYHWSPRDRRNSILKYGLVPGKLSKDKDWRPYYICFSKEPNLAWCLSGQRSGICGEWDLWMTWSNYIGKYIIRNPSVNGDRYYTEFRSLVRVPKGKIWYVGTRFNK